jgi:hypothetical protein
VRARPGCSSLQGLDPFTGGQKEYWVENDLIQFFYKQGWLDKFKAMYSVKEVLASPAVVFRGLGRDGQEDALSFAGLASHRYSKSGAQLPAPPNMTFVVYVRSDDVIFRWDWEKADPNLTYPLGYRERFGEQLWPKT